MGQLDLLMLIVAVAMCSVSQLTALAQINGDTFTNRDVTLAQQARAFEQATEKIRADCVQGRRIICGRIVKALPDGLVVDSGYTSLMRPPLNKSWLIPGTVRARREANLVESNEPGSVCVGLVFLTALPKSRSTAPKPYDYVVIQGYPTGQYTYTSVGTIRRTIRSFSAALASALKVNRAAAGIQPPVVSPNGK
jgi:hypothetical protein